MAEVGKRVCKLFVVGALMPAARGMVEIRIRAVEINGRQHAIQRVRCSLRTRFPQQPAVALYANLSITNWSMKA